MDFIHHKSIKQFFLDGSIHDESAIPRLKIEYVKLLTTEMRLAGYAQRLDVDTDFTIEYIEDKEIFTFKISIYGTYVGKKKAEWIQGIDGNRIVPMAKTKLKGSLQGQESRSNPK